MNSHPFVLPSGSLPEDLTSHQAAGCPLTTHLGAHPDETPTYSPTDALNMHIDTTASCVLAAFSLLCLTFYLNPINQLGVLFLLLPVFTYLVSTDYVILVTIF